MERLRSSDDRPAGDSPHLGTASVTSGNASESNGEDEVGRAGPYNCGGGGARYKLMSPAKLPISRSPCLTIPPGLSPSSFLESPVLLSNIKAEPSPTTGSFFKSQIMHGYGGSTIFSSIINSCSAMDGSTSSRFEFQPTSRSNSTAGHSLSGQLASADSSNQQSGQSMQVQAQNLPCNFDSSTAVRDVVAASPNELSLSASIQEGAPVDTVPAQTDSDVSNQKLIEVQAPQTDVVSSMNERTSDDGYNWRKYGQKLVKGSEYPRSYYKCTHPNCEVKKLFERAPDGKIAEIIYKGTHDHPKPQPNRRLSAGSMISTEERSDRFSLHPSQEDKPSTISGQTAQNKDLNVTGKPLAPKTSENVVEVGLSPLHKIPDDADDDDDPFTKRRKMEIAGMDINSVIKPIREPRVVVQTLSEVDILDDGYRWRKYGQKVVRGNPNPRSYYKCTSVGCPVRKHVERASHDPKAVITTYEGKHNHDVPTARNNHHDNTTPSLAYRARPQDGETVSLDLGVGISSAADNSPDQHQAMNTESALGRAQMSTSNFLVLHAGQVTYPGYVNGAMIMYASKDNHGEGLNVRNPPLSHSTHPYPQNTGRLLMGP